MDFKGRFILIIFSIFLIQLASSANLLVDSSGVPCSDILGNPFCSVQAAIDNATSGDIIEVNPGNYTSFQIDKELEVFSLSDPFGSFPARIVPASSSSNYIIQITSSDVEVRGLLVDGSSNVGSGNHLAGIRVNTDASNSDLTDIVIENNYVKNIFMGPSGSGRTALGIQLYTDSRKNPSYELRRIEVINNTIEGVNSSLGGAYGIQTIDDVFNIKLNENLISGVFGLWSIGIAVDSHDNSTGKTGVEVIKNKISNISPDFNGTTFLVEEWSKPSQIIFNQNILENSGNGVLNKNFVEELDAKNNYWDSCDGPSSSIYYPFPFANGTGLSVIGLVDYSPFIGVCFDKFSDESCLFEKNNKSIGVRLEGENIQEVWMVFKNSNEEFNKTFNRVIGENYSFFIGGEEFIGGENVSIKFYSNDSFGFLHSSEEFNFYVRNKTDLIVSPEFADGLNNWYISEPEFFLNGDSSLEEVFYQWDSDDIFSYLGSFRLEDIPNQPNITAGTLELNYWSSFSCGNESINSKVIFVDLTNPRVGEYSPLDKENISSLRPEIYTYLEEEYQSNSGINLSSIKMFLNGEEVEPEKNISGLIDAEFSFVPDENLSLGENNVSIYFSDKSGRNNSFSWSFFVIGEGEEFNFSINSPSLEKYSDRRIGLNLSLERGVSKIEYIEYNSRNPRWRTLCRSCEEYGLTRSRAKSFDEGENIVGFRAIDSNEIILEEKNISFFVDSKEPRIVREEPRAKFANGRFSLEIIEDNLEDIFLNYGNEESGFLSFELNTSKCSFVSRNKQECFTEVNLSEFNLEEISFWFNASDIVGGSDVGREREIKVDVSKPVVNSFENESNGRRIKFIFNISEENFDKVEYIDYSENRPRWRTLCSRLDRENICERSKYFRSGEHNISINVFDEAGNFEKVLENEIFLVE